MLYGVIFCLEIFEIRDTFWKGKTNEYVSRWAFCIRFYSLSCRVLWCMWHVLCFTAQEWFLFHMNAFCGDPICLSVCDLIWRTKHYIFINCGVGILEKKLSDTLEFHEKWLGYDHTVGRCENIFIPVLTIFIGWFGWNLVCSIFTWY